MRMEYPSKVAALATVLAFGVRASSSSSQDQSGVVQHDDFHLYVTLGMLVLIGGAALVLCAFALGKCGTFPVKKDEQDSQATRLIARQVPYC